MNDTPQPEGQDPSDVPSPSSSASKVPDQSAAKPEQVDLGIPRCRGEVWDRIVKIHGKICRGEKFDRLGLCAEFEVGERTIDETLAFMRDRLEMPIVHSRKQKTYIYTSSCPYLPTVRVEPDEKFLLKLVARMLPSFLGSMSAERLKRVLKKFSVVVGGDNSFVNEATRGVVFPFNPPDERESRYLQILSEAIDGQQELEVDYQNAEAAAPVARIVAPMDLGYFSHRWVVFVHDVVRGKLKTYRLDRIHGVKTTGRKCERPTDYNLDEIIGGNLGAYTGTGRYDIRLRLTSFAAADARSQRWHRSQVDFERGEAGLEITLLLNNLVDITSKILWWGPLAEALSPPELRTRVREQLKATLAKYGE